MVGRQVRYKEGAFMKKFMLSILLLLTISGCSDSKANQTAVDENQLVITNYGRTITINEVPEKVLTMGPNTTELFVSWD